MTVFDQLSFEQRSLAIQRLHVLVETLKEYNLRDHLSEMGGVIAIGEPTIEDAQQKILEFSLNHFGQPYSHEAREDADKRE